MLVGAASRFGPITRSVAYKYLRLIIRASRDEYAPECVSEGNTAFESLPTDAAWWSCRGEKGELKWPLTTMLVFETMPNVLAAA